MAVPVLNEMPQRVSYTSTQWKVAAGMTDKIVVTNFRPQKPFPISPQLHQVLRVTTIRRELVPGQGTSEVEIGKKHGIGHLATGNPPADHFQSLPLIAERYPEQFTAE